MTATVESRLGIGPPATTVSWPRLRLPRTLQPGWPLAAYFVGYPVWWLLGVTQLACVAFAVVMAFELARRRAVTVPRGFGIWLLFLTWMLTGPFVAQVVAPGTITGFALNHYFGWAYRVSMLVTGSVAMIYVATLRLSAMRVGRILSCMFVTIVAGGLLGVLAPHLSFPSLLELALPRHIDANPFIHAEVHPTPAELQDYVGDVRARPSAPFAFSNEWGLNFAIFLPFFLRTWFDKSAGWRRVAGPFVLLVALVPVVYSLNRGLWAALVVCAVFLAVRAALRGHFKMLATLLVVAVVVPVFVLVTPLKGPIEARFSGHNSNQGRTNLQTFAVTDMATTSPVVGFGATRRLQGSFHSISQGATVECPLCTPPAVGTQGRLWTVLFLFGFGGALLFLCFYVLIFLRHIRSRTPTGTMGVTVLLVSLVTMPVYDFSFPVETAVMCAISLLALEETQRSLIVPLGKYRAFVAANARGLGAFAVLGAIIGGSVAASARPAFQATAAIAIPPTPSSLNGSDQPPTLDDVAQVALGDDVANATATTLHVSPATVTEALAVGAIPNSRILLLTYDASTRAAAVAGAEATSSALLNQRRSALREQRASLTKGLTAQTSRLHEALRTIARQGIRLLPPVSPTDPAASDNPNFLLPRVQDRSARVSATALDPGMLTGPVTVRHDSDDWWVGLTSGVALSLLLGAVGLWWWRPRMSRIGAAGRSGTLHGTPVIATIDHAHVSAATCDPRLLVSLNRLLEERRRVDFIAVDSRSACRKLSRLLSEEHARTEAGASFGPRSGGSRQTVILVASTRTRLCRTSQTLIRLRHTVMDVSGVVLVDEHRPRAGRPTLFDGSPRRLALSHRPGRGDEWTP